MTDHVTKKDPDTGNVLDPEHEGAVQRPDTNLHEGISPHDLPKDHPGRKAAEEQAAENEDGLATGNV